MNFSTLFHVRCALRSLCPGFATGNPSPAVMAGTCRSTALEMMDFVNGKDDRRIIPYMKWNIKHYVTIHVWNHQPDELNGGFVRWENHQTIPGGFSTTCAPRWHRRVHVWRVQHPIPCPDRSDSQSHLHMVEVSLLVGASHPRHPKAQMQWTAVKHRWEGHSLETDALEI